MTIRHIEYFIKVCETGSFSKAAEELSVAQPSVSQTIKELEHYYNVNLFIRSNRKVTLTKEGKDLFAKAQDILSSFKEFEDTAKKITNNPMVRIGASTGFGIRALPLLIKYLQSKIPGFDYSIYMDKTFTLEEKIIQGELDFALAEGLPSNKMIETKVFAHDFLMCVAGNEYDIPNKISLTDLPKYDLFTREANSNPRKYLDYTLALKGIRITPKMVTISNTAIIKMVISNLGIAVMPRGVCEPALEKGLIRRIELDEDLPRPLHIISHKNRKMSLIAKKAMNLSVQYLKDYRNDD